ncbi:MULTISPECIES: TonB-dependent receptor [Flavobacterium]|uniref:TonB-dependent receptor n=1 Tax=Flavobacterium TaxID=237 RepID=UPI0009669F35|nr:MULTISPECIES: TonB-dependent receptor [Flavobacterium]MBN9284039.1 TonB-dependent receptor [Flavobacterium sp.]OJV73315.1 MAG: TonB-dependent receptor [Flavobacterium sp. 40-81]
MRKFLLTLFIITFSQLLFAQEKQKLSIEFNNTDIQSALKKIETTTNYKFYFDSSWLDAYKTPITKSYTDTAVDEILSDIFANTDLNFFIDNKNIILTNNSIIYDKLVDNYFGNTTKSNPNEVVIQGDPVFYQQYDDAQGNPDTRSNSVSLIGKEGKKTGKKTFELSGYIKNTKNGEPISNVVVKTQNNEATAITDEKGYYSMQVPSGLNIVEIESFTHKKVSRKVMMYNNGTLNMSVTENVTQLEEVNVRGKRREGAKGNIAGVTTINLRDLKNVPTVLGERDILKIATTIPGIKTAGEGSSGVNVRGGKEDQNLFLLDNATLYNPSHFFGFFSAINPYTIDKADIYKGSIPAEFGGRLSSVFDISTKKGDVNKVTGEAGIGPVTSNVTVSTPIVKGKSSLLAGVRATYSDWILKSLNEESLKNSKAGFYDGILKYSHQINDNNSIEATAYYSHDSFSITSDSLYKYSNRLASLKWNHKFNEKHKGDLILTNTQYKFNIDFDEDTTLKSFDYGYKINETQLQLKMEYARDKKHTFSYGLSSKLYGIDPGYLSVKNPQSPLLPVTIASEKGLESALFVGDAFKVTDKLLFNIGLRYSIFAALGASSQRIYEDNLPKSDATVKEVQAFGSNEVVKTYGGFEPRISAKYSFTEDFSAKVSYDKTYQYMHLLSSNTTQSPMDSWKLSDINVKPQNAQQFSLGFYKTLSEGLFEVSLEGYYKKMNNILDYKVGAELVLNEHIETELLQGKGKAYGVELLLKKTTGKLNGWVGYTYSRTFIKLDSQFDEEKVNNGDYFAANFDKPHDFSAVLNYKFTKRYSLSMNFIYQTGRPITYPVGTYHYGNAEYTLYSDRNKFRIPDYYRLDIGLNIEGNHKIKKFAHSFWNISVYNVLGRNNPYSVYFVTKEGEIKAYKTSIFSIPVPTVTYNFKF